MGSLLTWNYDCSREIKRRIARATGAMAGLKKIRKSLLPVHKHTDKLSIIRSYVMNVLLYACETWTPKKRDNDSLMAFEMKCFRRIIHIHWQHKIKNLQIRRRLHI